MCIARVSHRLMSNNELTNYFRTVERTLSGSLDPPDKSHKQPPHSESQSPILKREITNPK
jgi:hypothetical protein